MQYTVDTNAGPVVQVEAEDVEQAKHAILRYVPVAHEAGNVVEWVTRGRWIVAIVRNADGGEEHTLAFCAGRREGGTPVRFADTSGIAWLPQCNVTLDVERGEIGLYKSNGNTVVYAYGGLGDDGVPLVGRQLRVDYVS